VLGRIRSSFGLPEGRDATDFIVSIGFLRIKKTSTMPLFEQKSFFNDVPLPYATA
jgi:hypothetical protein